MTRVGHLMYLKYLMGAPKNVSQIPYIKIQGKYAVKHLVKQGHMRLD